MDKIKVVGPYILVKPEVKEERIVSHGIILTGDDAKIPETYAKIIGLGTGVTLPNGIKTKFSVKIGDTVIYKGYSGDNLQIDGEEYTFLLESDILAILSPNDKKGRPNKEKK
jgi:co-chaperonin GroES (HSP10)